MSHKVGSIIDAIDGVMYKHSRSLKGLAVSNYTPLDALMDGENHPDEDLMQDRREAFDGIMLYIFADGPEPLAVIRRVYAVAKAVRPELLGNMSLEDIALLCCDGGRATVSARIERIYNSYIRSKGGGEVRASFQKTLAAKVKYSQAQKGNVNRKGKKKKS